MGCMDWRRAITAWLGSPKISKWKSPAWTGRMHGRAESTSSRAFLQSNRAEKYLLDLYHLVNVENHERPPKEQVRVSRFSAMIWKSLLRLCSEFQGFLLGLWRPNLAFWAPGALWSSESYLESWGTWCGSGWGCLPDGRAGAQFPSPGLPEMWWNPEAWCDLLWRHGEPGKSQFCTPTPGRIRLHAGSRILYAGK